MLKGAVLTCAAAYVLLFVFVWVSQRSLLYFPYDERVLPADAGLSGFTEVALRIEDDSFLYSWWRRPTAGRPVILFFQGNGGSISHRTHRFAAWADRGFGVFALGYPGYGGSDGSPSERSLSEASRLAWQWLADEGVASDDIVLYGESLGSAVAVKLAASRAPRALVLEAPMSSVREVAKTHYPYLPVTTLLRDPWLSVDHVADVEAPLLIFHGDRDAIVPITSGETLFDTAREPKQFHVVRDAGHNDLFRYSLVDQLEEFLSRTID